jgi:DNA-binding NtrC family response regulator
MEQGVELSKQDPTVCSVVPVTTERAPQPSPDAWLLGRTLAEIERSAFLDTLDATGGNRAETARRLGVSEKTVYNKLRAWNLLAVR